MFPDQSNAAFSGVQSPTSDWYTLLEGDKYDGGDDLQAAASVDDLVGAAGQPLLYGHYNPADGQLSFRARLGGVKSKGTAWSFDHNVVIGLDYARVDTVGQPAGYGKIDLFIVCSSKTSFTAMYNTGDLANTSPATTSLGGISGSDIAHTPANYSFAHVTPTIFDSGTYNDDVDANDGTDAFVSFSVPMSLISVAASALGLTVSPSTPVAYGLATTTQLHSINGDFGGINDKLPGDLDTSWSALTTSPAAPIAIPEPSVVLSFVTVTLSALTRRQRAAPPRKTR